VRAINETQLAPLALVSIPGLGVKGIANVWVRNATSGRTLVDFFHLDADTWKREYQLTPGAVDTLCDRKSLEARAQTLQQTLADRGITWLIRDDADFPLLFTFGNSALLEGATATLLNSRTPDVESSTLEITCLLTQQLAQRNFTLVTSLHQFGYVIAAYKARKLNASLIFVLDRGIVPVVDKLQKSGGRDRATFTTQGFSKAVNFDLSRHLLVSPFKPLEKGAKAHGAWRDRCVISLAIRSIAVHIRRGGNMEAALREAHQCGKTVWVCRFPASDKYGSNQALIEAGCTPLTLDLSGSHLNALLADGTKTTPAHESDLFRRQRLGQFFTPRNVADFIWDALLHFAGGSFLEDVRAIDPAVGQGVFLWTALKGGYLPAERLYGLDIDETLLTDWQVNFKNQPQVNLFLANGLLDNPWIGLQANAFDLVIGNPPYGGEGLKALSALSLADKARQRISEQLSFLPDESEESLQPPEIPSEAELAELRRLAEFLVQCYETWRLNDKENFEMIPETPDDDDMPRLFCDAPSGSTAQRAVKTVDRFDSRRFRFEDVRLTAEEKDAIRRLSTFPIELLFVERFLQLCKPGGWIAIIVPDGVLANSQTQPIRDWLLLRVQVKTIISLPRRVFTGVGANAKTSVLFLRKYTLEERAEAIETGHTPKTLQEEPVWMASMDSNKLDDEQLSEYFERVMKAIKGGTPMRHTSPNPLASMVTTVSQPKFDGQRWDPDFWDADAIALTEELKAIPNTNQLVKSVKPLGDYIPDKGITYGVIVTGKSRKFDPKGNITCIISGHLYGPGILQREFKPTIHESDRRNRPDKHPLVGDLLFNRSGEGTLGRNTVFLLAPERWVVSDDVDLIRLEGISPFTTSLYLNSWAGQKLIAKYTKGVSGQTKINFEHIRALLVPKFIDEVEVEFEQKFKTLHSEFFDVQQQEIPNSQKEMLEKQIFESYQRLVKELLDRLGV